MNKEWKILGVIMGKRIDYIDILRGIGILYMVFGHIKYYPHYDYYIHAFHMPLFFFVSGLFFHRHNELSFFEFLKKISKQLLLPYFVCATFLYLYACITGVGIAESKLNTLLLIITVNNNGIPNGGALWFLTCLYFCQIILFLLSKMIKKDSIFGLACLSIMVLGIYFKSLFHIDLWWSVHISFVGVGLVYLGYLVNKYNVISKLTNTNLFYTLIILIIHYFCIMNTGYVNMRTGTYPNLFLFLLNFALSMIFYLNISKIILKYNVFNKVGKFIKYIGNNSIIFLCFNQFVIYLCYLLLERFGITDIFLNFFHMKEFIYSFVIYFLTIFILYLLTKIIMGCRLKHIFGK